MEGMGIAERTRIGRRAREAHEIPFSLLDTRGEI